MQTFCDYIRLIVYRSILRYPRKWGNLSLWTWCKTYLLNGTQATVGERGSPDPLGSWVLHNKMVQESKTWTKWLMFVDLDEFVLPIEKDDLPSVLEKYESYPGLVINWRVFGSSDLAKAPTYQIPSFLYRTKDEEGINREVKSIVQPSKAIRFQGQPHSLNYAESWAVDEDYEVVNGPFNDKKPAKKIRINHYMVRSREDFERKKALGRADCGQFRDETYWLNYNKNDVFDDLICRKYWDKLRPLLV